MPTVKEQQAFEIQQLLEDYELPQEARERLAELQRDLLVGRIDEMVPPNIPIDEPIPGRHRQADAARAESATGDLPRSDRAPAMPPEEIRAPHAFATPVKAMRETLIGEMNEEGPSAFPNAGRASPGAVERITGSYKFPPLPD